MLFQAASDRGHIPALVALGDYYIDENNEADAKKCYQKAAGTGNNDARYRLAKLRTENEALTLYYSAAKQGHPGSQTAIGDCWIKGKEYWLRKYGIFLGGYCAEPQEDRNAIECDIGEEVSFKVGETVKVAVGPFLYHNGIVEEIDLNSGKLRVLVTVWGRTIPVELEYWQVEKYDESRQIEEDKAEAANWYRMASEQGYAEAQRKLGDCYAEGWIVSEDYKENTQGYRNRQAAKWYRKAAEQDDAEAQAKLAHCYAEGIGVAQNESQAAKWYRKCGAYEELGDLYAMSGEKRRAAKAYRKAGIHWASFALGNRSSSLLSNDCRVEKVERGYDDQIVFRSGSPQY